jgi:hypothetical protein
LASSGRGAGGEGFPLATTAASLSATLAIPRRIFKFLYRSNSFPRNDLQPKIKNLQRFFLKLGHPFCYIQSSEILNKVTVQPVSQDRKELGTRSYPHLPAPLYSFLLPKNPNHQRKVSRRDKKHQEEPKMTPNYRAFSAEFQPIIFCAAISGHPSRHKPLSHKDLRNRKTEFFPTPLFKTMHSKTLFLQHNSLPPKHLHQHAFFAQLFSSAIDPAKKQNDPLTTGH